MILFLLVYRPCIFVPTDVLWQGGFPFEPKHSVGATVARRKSNLEKIGKKRRQTNKQTEQQTKGHTDITTSGLIWPRGQFSENLVSKYIFRFILIFSNSMVYLLTVLL